MNEKEFVEFAEEIGKLKRIVRTGWVKQGKIENPESVADHLFRSTILGMLIAKEMGLDVDKVIKMSLLHELEEAVTGDIMTTDKVKMKKEEIIKMEDDAIKKVFKKLSPQMQEYFYRLWKEAHEESTKEARLVQIIDGIEMMIQEKEYEKEFPDNKRLLEPFWNSPKMKLLENDEFAKKVLDYLRKYH